MRRDLKSRLVSQVAHGLIRSYQLSLSGLVGRQCRYLPTCSDYADEAIARYGLGKGGRLALMRLCRCHPWGGSGYDPVPDIIAGERRIASAQERASSWADRP